MSKMNWYHILIRTTGQVNNKEKVINRVFSVNDKKTKHFDYQLKEYDDIPLIHGKVIGISNQRLSDKECKKLAKKIACSEINILNGKEPIEFTEKEMKKIGGDNKELEKTILYFTDVFKGGYEIAIHKITN